MSILAETPKPWDTPYCNRGQEDARLSTATFVPTVDGRLVALHFYGAAQRSKEAVLCVHGIGANRNNFDLFGDVESLPRQLNARGHDVYVIELRGNGHSRTAGDPANIHDYLEYDLPAAVDHILLSHDRLHWVGHSLGGILGYMFGGRYPGRLRSLTSVAGPLPAAVPLIGRRYLVAASQLLARQVHRRKLPNRLGAKALGLSPALARLMYNGVLFASDNISDELLRNVAADCLEDVSLGVLRHLAEWCKAEGPFAGEIERSLRSLRVPTLFLGATKDPLCPPAALKEAHLHMPAGFGDVRIVSRQSGHTDFGHGDILVSHAAKRHVCPQILDFIADREPARALDRVAS